VYPNTGDHQRINYNGQPQACTPADGHTGMDIAKYLGVSRATLYRYLSTDSAA
jgi:hypothetical protein